MLLMAATAFSQTSRRTTNDKSTARNVDSKTNASTDNRNTNTYERTSSTAQTRATTNKTYSTANNNNKRASSSNTSYSKQGSNSVNTPKRNKTVYSSNRSNNYEHRTVVYPSSRKFTERREIRHYYNSPPKSITYRAVYYPYRAPVHFNIYWNKSFRIQYCRIYPEITYYYYPLGYRIETISAYDAMYYQGEIMNVYGRVSEVFYSPQYDEYILYFGPYYPYHDFTIVIPGRIALKYSRRPEIFFDNQYIVTTGLITTFEGKPEIVVKEPFQIKIY